MRTSSVPVRRHRLIATMQANGTTKNASVHSSAGSTSRHAVRRSCAAMDAVDPKGAPLFARGLRQCCMNSVQTSCIFASSSALGAG